MVFGYRDGGFQGVRCGDIRCVSQETPPKDIQDNERGIEGVLAPDFRPEL